MDQLINVILPVLLLLALALTSFYLSRMAESGVRSLRQKNGILSGEVIYSDLDRPAPVLYSRSLALSGKPDYLVRDRDGGVIPVEIKSGRAQEPHRGHMLQLAAYCLLVEENYNVAVPYGILVYADRRQHKIEFNKHLRADLVKTIEEMRRAPEGRPPERGHRQRKRCRSCSFYRSCSSRLD